MPGSQKPGPSLSRNAGDTTASPPAVSERGDNTASTIAEAPQIGARNPLDAHDFPSGGGGGGAQAFSRKTLTLKKKKDRDQDRDPQGGDPG